MSEYSEEYTANDYHKLLTMAGEAIIALEAENRELKDRNAKLSSIISRSVWKGGVCE